MVGGNRHADRYVDKYSYPYDKMPTMFSDVVEALIRSGLTESEIAARVGSSQSWINRIRRGKVKSVGYALGDNLLKLADERGVARPPAGPPDPKAAPAGQEGGGGHDSLSSDFSSASSGADPIAEAA